MTCTFFGHKDTPENIKAYIREILIKLIEQSAVDKFYVGNNGKFDAMVASTLKELKIIFPHISYAVVLAYLPTEESDFETIYPEGLERVPLRFAIDRRNRWMLERADMVVCYVKHNWGGAYKFKTIAERKNINFVNIAD